EVVRLGTTGRAGCRHLPARLARPRRVPDGLERRVELRILGVGVEPRSESDVLELRAALEGRAGHRILLPTEAVAVVALLHRAEMRDLEGEVVEVGRAREDLHLPVMLCAGSDSVPCWTMFVCERSAASPPIASRWRAKS